MWQQFNLQPELVDILENKLKLNAPTEVQNQVLTLKSSKCDIFAASQTGTGKTFCFILPILDQLIKSKKNQTEAQKEAKNGERLSANSAATTPTPTPKSKTKIQALIVVPTRELALQISNEFKKFREACKFRVSCLIGGMSRERQIRLLGYGSDVVIATVGRLLDLIQTETSVSLRRLGMCRFLVIDEVDRLIELGQFKELKQILGFVDEGFRRKKKGKLDLKMSEDEGDQNEEQGGAEQDSKEENLEQEIPGDARPELEDDYIEIDGEKIKINDEFEVEEIEILDEAEEREIQQAQRSRRTLLFSATLTQISWTSRMLSNKKLLNSMKALKNNQKYKHLGQTKEFPKIFDIMRKIRTNFRLEIVNCTQSEEEVFPDKMEIVKVKCIAQEKMLHLYYFLESEGCTRNIIFCNSVRSSRQVLNILNYCGVKALGLHSHMQQRQRIKKVEQFQKSTHKVALVTTDVASRGLHVENVGLVVHFHTPRDYDTFVHRSGRTARMGNGGKVVLLEDSHDRKRFAKFKRDVVHKNLDNIGRN